MSDKPALTCMVGRPVLDSHGEWYGYVTDEMTVTLERAVEMFDTHEDWKVNGWNWVVLVDPNDQQALTLWEALQRSRRQ